MRIMASGDAVAVTFSPDGRRLDLKMLEGKSEEFDVKTGVQIETEGEQTTSLL